MSWSTKFSSVKPPDSSATRGYQRRQAPCAPASPSSPGSCLRRSIWIYLAAAVTSSFRLTGRRLTRAPGITRPSRARNCACFEGLKSLLVRQVQLVIWGS